MTEPIVKYYYNRSTKERIRVEPAINISVRGTNTKFDLKKNIEKITKANPNAAIILDDFLSKKYKTEAESLGFKPYMNFPTQLTLNINQNNTTILL